MEPAVLRAALGSFLQLPVAQRCAVILKDVLGHSLEEAAETMGATVPAVKAALFRGRATLRASQQQAPVPAARVAVSDPEERQRLHHYVELFNTRNWDGLRELMATECQLDLVAKAARRGAEVRGYLARYAAEPTAQLAVGQVDGRPALLFRAQPDAPPSYFILLEWQGDRVARIRDFRYVPYIAREAALELAAAPATTAG